jgi:hypothetical protein
MPGRRLLSRPVPFRPRVPLKQISCPKISHEPGEGVPAPHHGVTLLGNAAFARSVVATRNRPSAAWLVKPAERPQSGRDFGTSNVLCPAATDFVVRLPSSKQSAVPGVPWSVLWLLGNHPSVLNASQRQSRTAQLKIHHFDSITGALPCLDSPHVRQAAERVSKPKSHRAIAIRSISSMTVWAAAKAASSGLNGESPLAIKLTPRRSPGLRLFLDREQSRIEGVGIWAGHDPCQ